MSEYEAYQQAVRKRVGEELAKQPKPVLARSLRALLFVFFSVSGFLLLIFPGVLLAANVDTGLQLVSLYVSWFAAVFCSWWAAIFQPQATFDGQGMLAVKRDVLLHFSIGLLLFLIFLLIRAAGGGWFWQLAAVAALSAVIVSAFNRSVRLRIDSNGIYAASLGISSIPWECVERLEVHWLDYHSPMVKYSSSWGRVVFVFFNREGGLKYDGHASFGRIHRAVKSERFGDGVIEKQFISFTISTLPVAVEEMADAARRYGKEFDTNLPSRSWRRRLRLERRIRREVPLGAYLAIGTGREPK